MDKTDVTLIDNRSLCADWLDYQSTVRGCVPRTLRQYAQRLECFVSWADGRELGALTLSELESWTHLPMANGKARAEGSIDRDAVILRGLYGWAASHGRMLTNPAADLKAPPVRNANPRAIADELWLPVWRADMDDNMRMTLGLGYFCGLRREEICKLQHVHWDAKQDRFLHFARKGDRNSKLTGVIPVGSCARLYATKRPDLLADAEDFLRPLRAAVRAAKPFLLPWGGDRRNTAMRIVADGQTNPDQINSRLIYLLRRLGMPERAFTPHDLRHSFCTNLLGMGIPIQEVSKLANHSSLNITMRYLKIAEDPLAKYLDGGLADAWKR